MNENELDLTLRAIGRSHVREIAPPELHELTGSVVHQPAGRQRFPLPLPTGRFQSMLSATKFVVAGAIVALFGGFLLAGVLTTQPSDDQLPAVGASATAETEQVEPRTPAGAFSAVESLAEAPIGTATLLADGRVLHVDGVWAEIWDPATGALSAAGKTQVPRERGFYSDVLLSDGRALIVGGDMEYGDMQAEVWDPATRSFSAAGAFSEWHSTERPSLTLLPDGRVLVMGGGSHHSDASQVVEVWEPESATFRVAGEMSVARAEQTATLLQDGRVLVVGGETTGPGARETGLSPLAPAEIWDPVTEAFSPAGSLSEGRAHHSATLLQDGRVLIIGGGDTYDYVTSSAEIWDPATETFTPAGSLSEARARHTATLLRDGRVLVVGGWDGGELPSAEVWDPATSSFTPAGSLLGPRYWHTATLLPDGRVLVTGDAGYPERAMGAEVWEPTGWRPPSDVRATTPDLLPGVDLVTEEVEPGLYRVVSDGVRDLIEPRSMAIGQDGHVWLTWEGQRHDADRQDPGLLRRLGEPREQAHEAANWGSDMAVDTAGTFWGTHDPGLGEGLSVTSFDGSTWTIHDWPAAFEPEGFSVEAAPDGSVLVTSRDGVARIRDGEWTLLPSWEAVTRGLVLSSRVDATDDSVWLGCGGHIRTGEAGCEGLLRFDGTAWDVMTPVPGRSDLYAKHLAAGPDGTLWAYLHAADDEEDRYLARLRDDRWSVFSAEDGVPLLESTYEWGTDLSVDADGTLWMATSMEWDDPQASATGLLELPHGVASFDGSTWRQYLADVNVQQVEAIDGHVWALDREDYQGRGVYGSGLYVITPEAAATADVITVEPAEEAEPDDTPDLLPGVDLVTEEVEPGLYRVVSDGAGHDLQDGIRALATEDSVWVETRRVFELGRPGTYPSTRSGFLVASDDGSLWAASGDGRSLRSFDGEAWTSHDGYSDDGASATDPWWPPDYIGAFAAHPDGTFWRIAANEGDDAHTRLQRLGPDGWMTYRIGEGLPVLDCGSSCGEGWSIEITPDGTVWLGMVDGGLLRFDGSDWETVRPLGGDVDHGVISLAANRDGVLWAEIWADDGPWSPGTDLREERRLARFDGLEWEVFS